jgi:hypothetical protein
MLGRLACSLGFHRVVTTREGSEKQPIGGSTKATKQTAANFIHALCYRDGCGFHVIIDTHTGRKDLVSGHHAKAAS